MKTFVCILYTCYTSAVQASGFLLRAIFGSFLQAACKMEFTLDAPSGFRPSWAPAVTNAVNIVCVPLLH